MNPQNQVALPQEPLKSGGFALRKPLGAPKIRWIYPQGTTRIRWLYSQKPPKLGGSAPSYLPNVT